MNYGILSMIFTFSVSSVALSDSLAPPGNQIWEIPVASQRKAVPTTAKVQFTQIKNRVRLGFEGSGLLPGEYALSFINTCKSLPGAQTTAKKSNPTTTELHRFKTEYGEISTEKTLAAYSLDPDSESFIGARHLALFKVLSNKMILIGCKTLELRAPAEAP